MSSQSWLRQSSSPRKTREESPATNDQWISVENDVSMFRTSNDILDIRLNCTSLPFLTLSKDVAVRQLRLFDQA